MACKGYYLTPEGNLQHNLSEEEIKAAFESKEGLLWVDSSETTEEDGNFLEQTFNFHHLAVQDCVSPQIHSPKIEDFGDHIFVIVHGINHVVESEIVETAELAVFLGQHFVVSCHKFPMYSVEAVRQMVEDDGRPMKRGADFLAHTLIDALIDNIIPTIDKMGDVADEIEEEVIRNPLQTTLEAIMKLKRSTLRIHRVIVPQREVVNRFSRGEFKLITGEAGIFYRNIHDHLVRIEDLNRTIRERSDNALTTYLSSMANRQNEVMKTLSIVAAIFLPLVLIVGIYGMNFENMPELEVPWAYFAVLGLMGIVIASVIGWFWAKRWITWGRRQVRRVRPFSVELERLIWHPGRIRKRPQR